MKRRKAIRPRAIVLHVPADSGDRDYRDIAICRCGSAWDASVHNVPERTDEERAVEQRKVGERE